MSTVTRLHALADGMIGKEESSFLHKAASELIDCQANVEKLTTRMAEALDNNERQKRLLETQRDCYDAALIKNEKLGDLLAAAESEIRQLRMAALRASGWRECEDPTEANKGGDHGTDRGTRRE